MAGAALLVAGLALFADVPAHAGDLQQQCVPYSIVHHIHAGCTFIEILMLLFHHVPTQPSLLHGNHLLCHLFR